MESKKWDIELLKENDSDAFYQKYSQNTKSQFPELSSNVAAYFIEKDLPKDKIIKGISSKDLYIFIAKNNTDIVGYLIGNKGFLGVGFCMWLSVDNNFHGKGIGSSLLKNYEEKVKELGGHQVVLWCDKRNISYYEKRGYTIAGEVPKHYFGTTDYLAYKILQEPKEENFLRDFIKN